MIQLSIDKSAKLDTIKNQAEALAKAAQEESAAIEKNLADGKSYYSLAVDLANADEIRRKKIEAINNAELAAEKGQTDLADSWYFVADAIDYAIRKAEKTQTTANIAEAFNKIAEQTNKTITENKTRVNELVKSYDSLTFSEEMAREAQIALMRGNIS